MARGHHPAPFLETAKAVYERARRRSRWRFIKGYLSACTCFHCGEADPHVLDFHHVRGRKKFNVAHGVSAGYAVLTLVKEIEKCQILCANCHRRETGKSQGWLRFMSEPGGIRKFAA